MAGAGRPGPSASSGCLGHRRGGASPVDVVWNAVDIAMAIMTLTNLVALLWLFRWGVGALRDYEAQRADGLAEPVFRGRGNPYLPADVPGDVWA